MDFGCPALEMYENPGPCGISPSREELFSLSWFMSDMQKKMDRPSWTLHGVQSWNVSLCLSCSSPAAHQDVTCRLLFLYISWFIWGSSLEMIVIVCKVILVLFMFVDQQESGVLYPPGICSELCAPRKPTLPSPSGHRDRLKSLENFLEELRFNKKIYIYVYIYIYTRIYIWIARGPYLGQTCLIFCVHLLRSKPSGKGCSPYYFIFVPSQSSFSPSFFPFVVVGFSQRHLFFFSEFKKR